MERNEWVVNGCLPLNTKWMVPWKDTRSGLLQKGKLRHGINYQGTFALAAKMNTTHVLLSLVANSIWYLQQFDVKNSLAWRLRRGGLYGTSTRFS